MIDNVGFTPLRAIDTRFVRRLDQSSIEEEIVELVATKSFLDFVCKRLYSGELSKVQREQRECVSLFIIGNLIQGALSAPSIPASENESVWRRLLQQLLYDFEALFVPLASVRLCACLAYGVPGQT